MIHLQVRGEDGTIQARSEHGLVWGPELAGLDQSVFAMLGHLLPYADTVFNSRQVSALLGTDEFARELLDLGHRVLDGPHRYLWFLGD